MLNVPLLLFHFIHENVLGNLIQAYICFTQHFCSFDVVGFELYSTLQKISQLLLRVAQMSDASSARRRVPVIRIR